MTAFFALVPQVKYMTSKQRWTKYQKATKGQNSHQMQSAIWSPGFTPLQARTTAFATIRGYSPPHSMPIFWPRPCQYDVFCVECMGRKTLTL